MGTVVRLWRYPVKSMLGEACEHLDVPGEAQVERGWLGKTLAVGDEARSRVMDLTERCAMVGFAQADVPDDGRVLLRLADDADVCFGVHADILVPGRIRRGESVSALD